MQSLDDRRDEVQKRFSGFPTISNEYASLVDATHELAQALLSVTPISREQSIALTHLEEAMNWAGLAIIRGHSE